MYKITLKRKPDSLQHQAKGIFICFDNNKKEKAFFWYFFVSGKFNIHKNGPSFARFYFIYKYSNNIAVNPAIAHMPERGKSG